MMQNVSHETKGLNAERETVPHTLFLLPVFILFAQVVKGYGVKDFGDMFCKPLP